MFRGFMDHWAPSCNHISTFWKSDFDTCKRILDELIDDVGLNNFTFYTKWYSNGIKSSLPFLYNHPDASNTRTDNDWGRQIIDYLHSRGISVGAMAQLYSYEQIPWGETQSLGAWGEELQNICETNDRVIIPDITSDICAKRIAQLIREQLTVFPDLDFIFLEYEGINSVMAAKAYENYRIGRDLPPVEEVSYSQKVIDHTKHLGLTMNFSYSDQAQEMFTNIMVKNLQSVQKVIDETESKAQPGIVYAAHEWERFYIPETLPSEDWLLAPWYYYGLVEEIKRPAMRKDLYKHIREQAKLGRKSLYIGDATISPSDIESIAETMDFCESGEAVGYLGMGNPTVDSGLRWLNVTDDHIRAVRDFFKSHWPA